jgi:ABC superfamily ATP binding cassette transporter ABC protein
MLRLDNISIKYEDECILSDVNLCFEKGSINVITGNSGSGKSTLIKLINGVATQFENAKVSGDILFNDTSIKDFAVDKRADFVATVFQNPKTQFYTVNTTDEMAFALENRNIEREEILKTIDKYAKLLNIEDLLDRDIFKLSGGQKQLVAVASVACLDNEIYIFDEPSSSLDTEAIQRLKKALHTLKNLGKTVIVAEHRLYYLSEIMDKLIILDDKKADCIECGDLHKEDTKSRIASYNLRCLYETTKDKLKNVEIKSLFSKDYDKSQTLLCENFDFGYKNKEKLFDFNISFSSDIYFIIGKNGIGKTAFLRCLCGLNKCRKSKLVYKGKNIKKRENIISLVMQDVNYQLFTDEVWEEISIVSDDDLKKEEVLKDFELWDKKNAHPQSLSGGQKQRLLLAMCMVSQKPLVILDEPTSGLCKKSMSKMVGFLHSLKEQGKTVIIVSHDYEFINECEGRIIEFV